jgi:hypothetical protein
MRKLFLIFVATTGYTKAIANVLLVFFLLFVVSFSSWLYIDYQEVNLRNKITYQQEFVNTLHGNPRFIDEQERLIDYKRQYDTLRQYWFVDLVFGSRPNINIKVVLGSK